MCQRERERGGPFQDDACDHVTGTLLGLPPAPPKTPLDTRPNIPRTSESKENHPSLEPSVSRACRPGWGVQPGFCLTCGQAPRPGGLGTHTAHREQSAIPAKNRHAQ